MKKNLLLLAALGLALPTLAQTERGTTLIGLTAGNVELSRRDANRFTSFDLHPTLGYFVADNLVLGAAADLSFYQVRRRSAAPPLRQRSFGYGVAPFARYYVLGTGRHQVFAELGADLGWETYRSTGYQPIAGLPDDAFNRTSAVRGYHASLGYTYFLTPTAALEASAGYRRYTTDEIRNRKNEFDFRLGFSMFLPAKGGN